MTTHLISLSNVGPNIWYLSPGTRINQVCVPSEKFSKLNFEIFSLGRRREDDSVPLRAFPEFDQAQHHQASLVNLSYFLTLSLSGDQVLEASGLH